MAAELSQEALASRAGVSVDAISALERGIRHAPYKATLDLLIAALALDDDTRLEMEEAAKLARARRPQGQRHDVLHDLPDEFLPNNLPPQLTSFVDRETEVAEIKELLQLYRLVTVVGTGGAGKTRCAIKVAAEMLDSVDGVWLAELAPISDPSLVASVIARTLRIQEAPGRPMLDTLLAYLKRKRLLLILDNCEHVIDEARRVAAAILQGCFNVRIMATSRESLTIEGEQTYRMPSLPVPSKSELLSTEGTSQYGAVQLFSDRAASADDRFTLSVESVPDVAEICRRLDGIPLAIELAAARVKVLSPKQLAQKLDERFRVLTVGDRSARPRHQTMRALIDWSYDLLADNERRLFRKLSIFAGGFTLEAARAVFHDEVIDEIATLDVLSSLVDKSLVQAEREGGGMRYRLLESTRQYGHEKLIDAGEYDVVAREHARAFLTLAEQLSNNWETIPDRAWLAQAEPELENFRAALGWTLAARRDVLLGQRLTAELTSVWRFLFPAEGRRWALVAQGFVNPETPPEVIAALALTEAVLDVFLMQYKAALALGERALSEYAALDDRVGNVRAKRLVGDALIRCGKVSEGVALLHEALAGFRALGARKSVSSVLMTLGLTRGWANDVAAARQLFSEGLTVARAAGAERSAAITALNLAEIEFMAGDADVALRLTREALSDLRPLHDIRTVVNGLRNEAAYLLWLRRYDEARLSAQDAIVAAVDMQYSVDVAFGLHHLAALGALHPETRTQDLEERRRAGRVLGYVDARIAALGALREYTEQQEYDAMIPALRDALGENQLLRLMAEGSNWTEDHAVAEAMLI
jgi:predicted ATPase